MGRKNKTNRRKSKNLLKKIKNTGEMPVHDANGNIIGFEEEKKLKNLNKKLNPRN